MSDHPNTAIVAPRISPDSWLHDDRHEGVKTFREVVYPYWLTQTHCIAALAGTTPEGAYYLWLAGKRAEQRSDSGR